jgi:hypothetical protein
VVCGQVVLLQLLHRFSRLKSPLLERQVVRFSRRPHLLHRRVHLVLDLALPRRDKRFSAPRELLRVQVADRRPVVCTLVERGLGGEGVAVAATRSLARRLADALRQPRAAYADDDRPLLLLLLRRGPPPVPQRRPGAAADDEAAVARESGAYRWISALYYFIPSVIFWGFFGLSSWGALGIMVL